MVENESRIDKSTVLSLWGATVIVLVFFGGIGVFLLPRSEIVLMVLLVFPVIVGIVAIGMTISYLVSGRKKCPNCGNRMDWNIKFCKQCGAEVLTNCPHCKAELKSKASFCQACGKSITEPKSILQKETKQPISPVDDEIEPPFFCTYCGSQIEPDLSVCPACGESFK